MQCPKCRSFNPDSAEFCTSCGTDFIIKEKPLPRQETKRIDTDNGKFRCPKCNAANDADATFCSLCGNQFAEMQHQAKPASPQQETHISSQNHTENKQAGVGSHMVGQVIGAVTSAIVVGIIAWIGAKGVFGSYGEGFQTYKSQADGYKVDFPQSYKVTEDKVKQNIPLQGEITANTVQAEGDACIKLFAATSIAIPTESMEDAAIEAMAYAAINGALRNIGVNNAKVDRKTRGSNEVYHGQGEGNYKGHKIFASVEVQCRPERVFMLMIGGEVADIFTDKQAEHFFSSFETTD